MMPDIFHQWIQMALATAIAFTLVTLLPLALLALQVA